MKENEDNSIGAFGCSGGGLMAEFTDNIKRLIAYSEGTISMELLSQIEEEYNKVTVEQEVNPLIQKPYLRGRNKKYKRFF